MPISTWLILIEDDERMKDKYTQSFIVKFMENENYTESFCCIIMAYFYNFPRYSEGEQPKCF